ncbi:MAG: helix-turn-helix transcriptional regulator [Chitinispirillaceae bacterium]|nr:helix-turn-helix transcriptional regulator [Chitinispirillaceae bacterium]
MKKEVSFLSVYIVLGFITLSSSQQSCIEFSNPVSGKIITSEICTITVEEKECPRRIKKVEFQASFFPLHSDTTTILSIGSVQKKPYTILWDISEIPNQLFCGTSLFAEAVLSNGDRYPVRIDGVFLLHKSVERPTYNLYYEFEGVKKINREPIRISENNIEIEISGCWNEKELLFIIDVKDPQFTKAFTKEQLSTIGVEILLDPYNTRKPFPKEEVFIYSLPLYGKPFRVLYKPVSGDSGNFRFNTNTMLCDFDVKIISEEAKGFKIFCPIPKSTMPDLTDKIGCNFVIKTFSENKIKRISWVKAGLYDTYSPYIWGELRIHPKPIYMNRLLIGSIGFAIGFFVTLSIAAIIILLTKPHLKKISSLSDNEKQIFVNFKETLDRYVLNKDINLQAIANELNIPVKKLSSLIKKATGMDFHNYVMYLRIEIAKERLRSSHCSEETIAKMCSFQSVGEMEKYFLKFYNITPSEYREEQQVV